MPFRTYVDYLTVIAFSLGLKNMLPPITQNISFSRYANSSKMTWLLCLMGRRIFGRRPSRIWRPVMISPLSHCQRIHLS